jgi:hypothetical protein
MRNQAIRIFQSYNALDEVRVPLPGLGRWSSPESTART